VAGKHAPIELGKYLEIHETAMRCLERENRYVLPEGGGLTIDRSDGGVLMYGRIRCVGGISIEVTKLLAILEGQGDRAIVQTVSYTYHVMLEGLGNVFRYCGPHDDGAHPGHKPFHHRHTYDVLRGDVVGTVAEVDAEERPTLAEVIAEACVWYHDHAHEIETLRAH
jgi:hypothetical protein